MDRLNKGVPEIGKQSKRTQHNSIYRKESGPDYYDSIKIASVETNLKTQKKNTLVELKKQTGRDMTKML